jgi:hypothetical protein
MNIGSLYALSWNVFKIAANGSRLCAVWGIEKQNLNYAEKFI